MTDAPLPFGVVLVRHGVTAWNQDKRLQGQLDVPLAPEGVAEAERLAAHLAAGGERFDRIVASDLSRASLTADIIGRALGLPVTHDPRWRERHLGELQGRRWTELGDIGHDFIAAVENPPGGEGREEQVARVAAALDAVRDAAGGRGRALVVTHGGCVKAALSLAGLGSPIVPNASLTELWARAAGGWEAGRIGDTAHLEAVAVPEGQRTL